MALMKAVLDKDIQKVEDLLADDNCDINAENKDGDTAIILAASRAKTDGDMYADILKILLLHPKSDINHQNKRGHTALQIALKTISLAAFKILLKDKRCDINKHGLGYSVLHGAALKFNPEYIKLLLEFKECEVNVRDKRGITPLHIAAQSGSREILHTLFSDNRCDINAVSDAIGRTPLHNASLKSFVYMYGSDKTDPYVLDKHGESPLFALIRSYGKKGDVPKFNAPEYFKDFLAVLRSRREGINASPHTVALATKSSYVETLEALLDANGDVNSSYLSGESALQCAVRMESVKKCELILKHKPKFDVQWRGMSPLEFGIAHGCKNVILEALSKTVPMTEIERYLRKLSVVGETPLTCSMRLGVMPWIQHFMDPNQASVPDNTGRMPLELSCANESTRKVVTSALTSPRKCNTNAFQSWYRFRKLCSTKVRANQAKQHSTAEFSDKRLTQHLEMCFPRRWHHPEVKHIGQAVTNLMDTLSLVIASRPKESHLEFIPLLAGSTAEGTKTYMPNEFDYICQFKNTTGLIVNKFGEVEIVATSKWDEVSGASNNPEDSQKYVHPRKLAAQFYSVLECSLDFIIAEGYDFGNLFLYRKSLLLKDKISCMHLLWRGDVFKDMVIYVDLVPAFVTYDISSDWLPMNVSSKEFHFIAKVSRHDPDAGHKFSLSHSRAEKAIMKATPAHLRDGFMKAKALRISAVCQPDDTENLKLAEDISSEDFVTSYMLKNCLYKIIDEECVNEVDTFDFDDDTEDSAVDNDSQISNDSSVSSTASLGLKDIRHSHTYLKHKYDSYEWADKIYEKMENFLMEGGIPFYHKDHEYVFECAHKDGDNICCKKKNVMLAIIRKMRSWINGRHLVYSRK